MYALHEGRNKMSLLTEEQIEDVIGLFNCYTNGRYKELFKHDLREWNKKQPSTKPIDQFEPDWGKAPDKAIGAVLNLKWVFKELTWASYYDIATYDRPALVITPHPHASLMAKYAEVAARRVDPWAEFEMRIGSISEWVKCDAPISFSTHWEYRYIGETK